MWMPLSWVLNSNIPRRNISQTSSRPITEVWQRWVALGRVGAWMGDRLGMLNVEKDYVGTCMNYCKNYESRNSDPDF